MKKEDECNDEKNVIENGKENIDVEVEMKTKIDDKYLIVLTEPATILSVACTLDAKVYFSNLL